MVDPPAASSWAVEAPPEPGGMDRRWGQVGQGVRKGGEVGRGWEVGGRHDDEVAAGRGRWRASEQISRGVVSW